MAILDILTKRFGNFIEAIEFKNGKIVHIM